MAASSKPQRSTETYTSVQSAQEAIRALNAERERRWADGKGTRDLDAHVQDAWDQMRQLVAQERGTTIHPSSGVSMSIVSLARRRPHIKLDAEKATAIRAANPQNRAERRALAAQHGVSEDTIRAVLANRIWKDQAQS